LAWRGEPGKPWGRRMLSRLYGVPGACLRAFAAESRAGPPRGRAGWCPEEGSRTSLDAPDLSGLSPASSQKEWRSRSRARHSPSALAEWKGAAPPGAGYGPLCKIGFGIATISSVDDGAQWAYKAVRAKNRHYIRRSPGPACV